MSAKLPDVEYDRLSDAIRFALDQRLKVMHTALPGHIDEYDRVSRRAVVRVALRLREAETGKVLDRPRIPGVPVVWPGTPRTIIHGDLQQGDPVLLIFSQRGMAGFLRAFQAAPADPGLMQQRDAIAIPTFGPVSITDAAPDADLILQAIDAEHFVSISDGGVTVSSTAEVVARSDTRITASTPQSSVVLEGDTLTHDGTNVGRTHTHRVVVSGDGTFQTTTPQ